MIFLYTGTEIESAMGTGLIALPFLILFGILFLGLAILAFLFWIFMILDCAKRKFKHENDKIVWILVIVLLHWIGALIYYFAIRQKYGKAK